MSARVQTRARKRAKAAPAKRAGRKPGQTSPAIADAARENGANGGRPRDRLSEDVLKRLGPPPAEAIALRTWNARFIAELQMASARGEIGHELAATLRAGATALDRALPARAADPEVPGADQDDDEDDEPTGPELEAAGTGEPLHVG